MMSNFALAVFDANLINNLISYVIRGILPILALVVIIWSVIRISNRKSAKDSANDQTQKFLNEDRLANETRMREIEDNQYYFPNLDILPIQEYSGNMADSLIATRQKDVIKLSEKKMMNLGSSVSNIELKKMFGATQLEQIAQYEENFSKYMHGLRFWSEALIKEGRTEEAIIILEESVAAKSQISASYTLLAEIYFNAADSEKLDELRKTVESRDFPGRKIALDYIGKHVGKLVE